MRKRKRKQYGLTAEDFIRLWNTSGTTAQAVERLGMPYHVALARVSKYRKRGIRLKKMPRKRHLAVNKLNALVRATERALAKRGGRRGPARA